MTKPDHPPGAAGSFQAPGGFLHNKWLPALLLVLLSFSINLINNDFSHRYHIDERSKIRAIESQEYNFFHPIGMLQTVRLAGLIQSTEGSQELTELGRTTTAFYGALLVFFVFLIFRQLLEPGLAFLAALALAITPTIVIHAHYLKEDMIFAAFAAGFFLFFMNHLEKPSPKSAIQMGLLLGLALSAQYKGLVLLPLFLAGPLFIPNQPEGGAPPEGGGVAYFKLAGLAMVVAALVFLGINYPLFEDFSGFLRGTGYEFQHALAGHRDVVIPPGPFYFSFHLSESLLPGITWGLLGPGLIGIIWGVWRWRYLTFRERLLLVWIIGFYLTIEASPLKPFPDFMRYVIPLVPWLIYFGFRLLVELERIAKERLQLKISAPLLAGFLLLWPLHDTVNLLAHLNRDTRAHVQTWLLERGERALFEMYAAEKRDVRSITDVDIQKARKKGYHYLAASSFLYDRYQVGSRLPHQNPSVYTIQKRYEALFQNYPTITFKPAFRAFAFSNPTIRLIDIRRKNSVPPPPSRLNGSKESD
ncbi:MAG: glycosyltransferase family 39 protein [Magnetococcales bacterium]|nr:glycosyltransferase family 39 protein [Magnetococcales bacterium]